MNEIDPTRDLYSAGYIAQMLNTTPDYVRQLAGVSTVKAEPSFRLNGVLYYDRDAVQRIRAYYAKVITPDVGEWTPQAEGGNG